MTQDIRLSIDFRDHPKIVRLHKLLGDSGVCSLVTFWAWARKYRPRGILVNMDADDIENGAKWAGETGDFVKTIVALKLLDLDGSTYVIHDWKEHQPWAFYSEERSQRARLAAERRWRKKMESTAIKYGLPGSPIQIVEEVHTGRIVASEEIDAPLPDPPPAPAPPLFPIPPPIPPPILSQEVVPSRADIPGGPQESSQSKSRPVTKPPLIRRPGSVTQGEYQRQVEDFFNNFLAGNSSTWAEAHPGIDVRADAMRAKLWLLAHPNRRKKNFQKFLTSWFARSQERGSRGKADTDDGVPYAPGTPEYQEYVAAEKRWRDQD